MYHFEAKNITKRFVNHTALNGVSIEVPEQSVFGLLGPNGAGKTTLIRIINMITNPDSGELLLRGKKLRRQDIEGIGYLPEERGLYKKMKVGEQALYLARLKGMSRHDALTALKEWFTKFEIENWWNKKVEELSKGMQQKVQFIVTVVHKPNLLIFDEPFSGFDPINVNLLTHEILRLKNEGSTIIFSTHNMASVEELCDHIALINKAKLVLKGEVQAIKKSYKSNSFRIEYSNVDNLSILEKHGFTVLKDGIQNGHQEARIQVPEKIDPNELIGILMQYASIHSFEEMLPTMNDIFISKVKEDVK